MDDKTIITLVVTVFIALSGFVGKYLNDVAIAKRKDRLERINQQLKNLYGPLYAIRKASAIAWREFRSICRPGKHFFTSIPEPNNEELEAWRLWMSEVFMPLNLKMEKTIVENSDLIIEEEMPSCFMSLCAHVAAYKPVIKKWEAGDYSQHTSLSNFPMELDEYVGNSYRSLKKEQAKLLNSLKIKKDN